MRNSNNENQSSWGDKQPKGLLFFGKMVDSVMLKSAFRFLNSVERARRLNLRRKEKTYKRIISAALKTFENEKKNTNFLKQQAYCCKTWN